MMGREVVMKRYALSVVFCVLFASAAFAQTKSPVEGVWKIAEVVTPGRDSAEKGATVTNSNPQPSLMIFTKGYYSQVFVVGDQPRAAFEPAKDPQNPTDAEKIARYEQWGPFVANSGTYEIKGSTIIRRAIVAKNVAVMTGATPNVLEFKLEGPNTLWLIPTGDQAATQSRLKLTRLE
jgi:hypothetical protein